MKRNNRNCIRLNRVTALLALSILASAALADGGGTYSVYDSNRDGYLDRQEFIPFAQSRERKGKTSDLWQFENVDRDGDEKISEQEMVDALIESLKGRNK